ncbi:MAG TPA: SRPBCC family protein [Thermoleophilaceae bacterium]|nr:SRPBCC family protein [Thermoleophilaceae bacterium]
MQLTNEFEVAVPVEEVWPALLDIERVARFLPGAEIEPSSEEGVYSGSMKVKLGPMTVSYRGTARLGDVDEESHSAAIEVEAREARGQGRAAATIVNRLVDLDGRTRVVAETDLRITGRQAQFGRGIMQDVAGAMLDDFARRFEASLLAEAGGAGAGTGSGAADGNGNGGGEGGGLGGGGLSAGGGEAEGGTAGSTAGGAEAEGGGAGSTAGAGRATGGRSAPPADEVPDALDMGAIVSGTRSARYGAAIVAGLVALLLLRRLRR